MYAQVEKSKASKNKAAANSVAQRKSNGMQSFGFIDNRPESNAINIIQKRKKDPSSSIYNAFADAAGVTLNVLRGMNESTDLLGYTSRPSISKPPRFNYGATENEQHKWHAVPTKANDPDKGNVEDVVYVTPGTYETDEVDEDTSKKVKIKVTDEISQKARQAEEEHVGDFNYAYNISLKHIHDKLTENVYTKTFGPADTKEDAKQLVNTAITSAINHSDKLGVDPVDWDLAYQGLFGQTKKRDDAGWHTFGETIDSQNDEWVTLSITESSSEIGTHLSSAVVTYADLENINSDDDSE